MKIVLILKGSQGLPEVYGPYFENNLRPDIIDKKVYKKGALILSFKNQLKYIHACTQITGSDTPTFSFK